MMDNLRGLTVECEGKRGVVTWQSTPPLPPFVHITFFDNSRGLKFIEDVKVIQRPTKKEFLNALQEYVDKVRDTCSQDTDKMSIMTYRIIEGKHRNILDRMIDGLDFEVDYNETN